MKEKLLSLLAPQGLLSQTLEGFEPRATQGEMLSAIYDAYEQNKTVLIEAGTGTGKSLAYLLPALLWALEHKETTVVATHTIALQEQLVQKDIPFLIDALKLPLKVVLVKGMSNYLCLRKLHDALFEKFSLPEEKVLELEQIEKWAGTTTKGSRTELPLLPSSETWERVCAESENCTHAKCPHNKECFFFKARREMADAHLLVTNHHLLCADLNLRQEMENFETHCILPPFSRLILDEAHHLEEVATDHFAKRLSRFSFFRLVNRILSEKNGGKLRQLEQKLKEAPQKGEVQASLVQFDLDFPYGRRRVLERFEELFRSIVSFAALFEAQEKVRVRAEDLAHPFWITEVQKQAKEALEEGRRWTTSLACLLDRIEKIEALKESCEGTLAEIRGLVRRLEQAFEVAAEFCFSPDFQERVRWIETTLSQNVTLVSARLDIASLLASSLFERIPTVVLCSATLSTKKEFTFIRKSLGIREAVEKLYASPFDYETKTRLLVPLDMPHPDQPRFLEAASERIFEAVVESQGGTIVLFTSYTSLLAVKEKLKERLREKELHLLCQGEESAHTLLAKFRKNQAQVLFGTDSFWEGVDVVGEALRCVVIFKLPFLVPSDPLFQARSEKIVAAGGSPFFDYSLPQAAMKFKQGFGRLIRSKEDRGCVICLDHRLATKGYGKVILSTLPPSPRLFTSSEELKKNLRQFYAAQEKK